MKSGPRIARAAGGGQRADSAKIYEYLRAGVRLSLTDPRGDAGLLRDAGFDAVAPLDSPSDIMHSGTFHGRDTRGQAPLRSPIRRERHAPGADEIACGAIGTRMFTAVVARAIAAWITGTVSEQMIHGSCGECTGDLVR
jgi:hypothetical protein